MIFSRKARIDIYPKAMHLPTYPKPDPPLYAETIDGDVYSTIRATSFFSCFFFLPIKVSSILKLAAYTAFFFSFVFRISG